MDGDAGLAGVRQVFPKALLVSWWPRRVALYEAPGQGLYEPGWILRSPDSVVLGSWRTRPDLFAMLQSSRRDQGRANGLVNPSGEF